MLGTSWYALCSAAFAAGCGGNTVSVIESKESPDAAVFSAEGGPCAEPGDCRLTEVCHPDGQCHPRPYTCVAEGCVTGVDDVCRCQWTCTDSRYQARCRLTYTGLVTCNCGVDGLEFPWTCVVDEPTTDVCGMGTVCCGFPPSKR